MGKGYDDNIIHAERTDFPRKNVSADRSVRGSHYIHRINRSDSLNARVARDSRAKHYPSDRAVRQRRNIQYYLI